MLHTFITFMILQAGLLSPLVLYLAGNCSVCCLSSPGIFLKSDRLTLIILKHVFIKRITINLLLFPFNPFPNQNVQHTNFIMLVHEFFYDTLVCSEEQVYTLKAMSLLSSFFPSSSMSSVLFYRNLSSRGMICYFVSLYHMMLMSSFWIHWLVVQH